jgi:hypothetical protein
VNSLSLWIDESKSANGGFFSQTHASWLVPISISSGAVLVYLVGGFADFTANSRTLKDFSRC